MATEPPMSNENAPSLLRLREVCRRVGLAKSSIHDAIRAGRFPRPTHQTPHTSAWVSTEIDEWVASRIAERDGQGGAA